MTGNDPQSVAVPAGGTGATTPVGFHPQGTITGHVFEDTDGNGVQEAGEPDLAGVDVTITDSQSGTQTVTTDASGNYSATVPDGNTSADVTVPIGTILTTGNDPQAVAVPQGGTGTATDVGYQPQGTISGHVLEDTDGNGVQDAGEPDLAGVERKSGV